MTTPTPTPAASLTAPMSSTTMSSSASFMLNYNTPALTTTFTPPAQCTEAHITMLSGPNYNIWLNEPVPVPGSVFSECYPPEYMTSYLQMASHTLLPAFSPLVCPRNYYTVSSSAQPGRPIYVACCPSSYGWSPPKSAIPGRPAFGGTCFSNITNTNTYTEYDSSTLLGTQVYTAWGQAYAHAFDGYSTNTASADSDATAGIGTGAIAGIVVGCVAFFLLLLAGLLFFMRARKRAASQTPVDAPRGPAPPGVPGVPELSYDNYHQNPYMSHSNEQKMSYGGGEKRLPPTPAYEKLFPYGHSDGKNQRDQIHELPDQHNTIAELDHTLPSRTISERSARSRSPVSPEETRAGSHAF